ncbi:hypothetical protein [Flavobacterium sp. LB3R33]|jgi:hypothetical protein|uniref:hypothetical protein n=1 Tax=Flavobacterium sp. LB3R33 TaxID=3401721 RepID=UPI003AAE7894
MKSFLSLLFVSSILLTSCKKEVEPQNNATPTNVVPFTEVGKQMKTEASTATQVQQTTNTVNPNNAVAAGMNPAHGQPSHRCDIPVGAPLNSPPASTANKPVVQQQNQPVPTSSSVTTSTPVATTPTPEGMNPPHGQTNHRCDIAVGAALPKS